MFGGKYGLPCGLEFFGSDHVVFATDAPLGPIARTLEVMDALGLDAATRGKIMVGNAERLMNMRLQ